MKSGWIRVRGWRPFGAEVWIHWGVVAVAVAALGLVARDPAFMALVLASYFLILVVHESGHAWMARKCGMRVLALEFSVFHGRCSYMGRDATPLDHARVAWAGPLAQLGLAVSVFALAMIPTIRELDAFGPLLVFTGYFNAFWAMFNLVPARGFDGELAWRGVIDGFKSRRQAPRKPRPPLRRVK
jgi:Zn-dependent protease